MLFYANIPQSVFNFDRSGTHLAEILLAYISNGQNVSEHIFIVKLNCTFGRSGITASLSVSVKVRS